MKIEISRQTCFVHSPLLNCANKYPNYNFFFDSCEFYFRSIFLYNNYTIYFCDVPIENDAVCLTYCVDARVEACKVFTVIDLHESDTCTSFTLENKSIGRPVHISKIRPTRVVTLEKTRRVRSFMLFISRHIICTE